MRAPFARRPATPPAPTTLTALAPLILVILLSLVLGGCGVSVSTGGSSTATSGQISGPHQLGTRTKTSGCQVNGKLPDSACTPGAIFSDATTDKICQSGYASSVRNVPTSEKDQVYSEYGIASHYSGEYEVDHLVSLELGGSNDIANLWPEAASPPPGFHQKDQAENYLHDQVCSGKVPLQQAQYEIATNWLQIYQQMQQNP